MIWNLHSYPTVLNECDILGVKRTLSLTLLHIFRVSLRPPTPGAINAPDSVTPVVLEWWPYVSNAEKGLTICAFHYHNVSVRRTEMAYQHVRYSKENLKIHTGSPPSLPSLPYPPLLFFPSLCPFPSLPISLFPLEVGPLNPARGSGDRAL